MLRRPLKKPQKILVNKAWYLNNVLPVREAGSFLLSGIMNANIYRRVANVGKRRIATCQS